MRHSLLLLALSAACSAAAEHAEPPKAVAHEAAGQVDTIQATTVRALYVNRWASQSKKRMAKLIAAADSTEINALVIDEPGAKALLAAATQSQSQSSPTHHKKDRL